MIDTTGATGYTYQPITPEASPGAGQLASIDGPLNDDTIAYGYDELGRMVNRSINGIASTWTYDQQGRLEQEGSAPVGTFTYAYVANSGRLQTVTYPNGQTTSYAYYPVSQDFRLQEIHNRKQNATTLSRFSYAYDVLGNISTWTQQVDLNPTKAFDFEYDRAGQLILATYRTTDPTPSIVKRYRYAYDAAGNRTAEQIEDVVTGASYDNMNRLVTQQPGGALLFKGAVNEPASVTIGGRPAMVTAPDGFSGSASVSSGTSQVTVQATDSADNVRNNVYQISQIGTTKIFSYDANGSLINDDAMTYEWNAEGALVAINRGTHRSEIIYNGKRERVRILEKDDGTIVSDKRFIWGDGLILEERDVSGAVLERYFGGGIQVGSATYFYATDHLGSIRQLVDSAGVVTASYDYDPWGRVTSVAGAAETPFQFTGHYFHAPSRLYLALYRAYDAGVGRWISEDPAREGANAYEYAGNSPATFGDLFGLERVTFLVITVIRGSSIGAGVKSWHRLVVDTDSGKTLEEERAIGATDIPIPGTTSVVPVPGRGDVRPAIVTGGKGCIYVDFSGWAATNTAPLPHIDYKFRVMYDSNKHEGHLSGRHNGYPSYQVAKNGRGIYDFQQGSLFQLSDLSKWVPVNKDFQ
jgi:RHS repeat-associated protein